MKYVLMLPIGEMVLDQVFGANVEMPPHLTIGGFATQDQKEAVVREMRIICANNGPIEITSTKFAWFGPNNDVPVFRVATTPTLLSLHERWYELCQEMDADFKHADYVGVNYKPHVTNTKTLIFSPGSRAYLDSAVLVCGWPGVERKIVGVFSLA